MVKFGAVNTNTEIFPSSSTANAVAKWNGTGGQTIQDSSTTIDVSGNLATAGYLCSTGGILWLTSSVCLNCQSGVLYFTDDAGSYCLGALAASGMWTDDTSSLCPTNPRNVCSCCCVCAYCNVEAGSCVCACSNIYAGSEMCAGGCICTGCGFFCGGYGGYTGSWTNGDGATVYVCGGVIYDVSC